MAARHHQPGADSAADRGGAAVADAGGDAVDAAGAEQQQQPLGLLLQPSPPPQTPTRQGISSGGGNRSSLEEAGRLTPLSDTSGGGAPLLGHRGASEGTEAGHARGNVCCGGQRTVQGVANATSPRGFAFTSTNTTVTTTVPLLPKQLDSSDNVHVVVVGDARSSGGGGGGNGALLAGSGGDGDGDAAAHGGTALAAAAAAGRPARRFAHHPLSPWRRRYMVAVVSLIAALLCADQNLLAPNLSAAAEFFGLDPVQKDAVLGGYLMAAFFVVGAPAALIIGWLADRHNRVVLLGAVVLVGEAPCLATYWVTQLWQFFLLRMLTGIAVGGCFPLVFSLLGDLFPASQRAAMASLVQIAIGAGIGGGQLIAGFIGPATNWRVPFVVMAAPSLALAAVLLLTATEPPRGGFEEALAARFAAGEAYDERSSWRKVRRLLRVPSNWIVVLQGVPGCLAWGVMQTFITDYLHVSKGYSVELATVVVLLFGIGCGVGVVAGGAAGQLLYNWRKEAVAVLTGLSVVAGAGPVLWVVNADLQAAGFGAVLVMGALAGFLVSIAGPNLRAILINVNLPETRGMAMGFQSVTDDLGRGLGPIIVAAFITRLGRQAAFNIAVGGWVPCGLMLLGLVLTLRRDEARMQRRLAACGSSGQLAAMAAAVGGGGAPDAPPPPAAAAALGDGGSGGSSGGSSSAPRVDGLVSPGGVGRSGGSGACRVLYADDNAIGKDAAAGLLAPAAAPAAAPLPPAPAATATGRTRWRGRHASPPPLLGAAAGGQQQEPQQPPQLERRASDHQRNPSAGG